MKFLCTVVTWQPCVSCTKISSWEAWGGGGGGNSRQIFTKKKCLQQTESQSEGSLTHLRTADDLGEEAYASEASAYNNSSNPEARIAILFSFCSVVNKTELPIDLSHQMIHI